MNPWTKAWYILRYLGPRIVWLRLGVYAAKLTGRSNRIFAPRPWAEMSLRAMGGPGIAETPADYAAWKRDHLPPFLFEPGKPPAIPDSIRNGPRTRQPSQADRLDLLQQMRCVYFFHTPSPEPIDWYHNPFTQQRSDPSKTWSAIPDYLPEQGDPRTLWEPSRGAWAIDLARAKAWTGADQGEVLWRWMDSWMDACEPYKGFQWKCGQEASVRLIAVLLGVWAHLDSPAMTDDRWVQLARFAWATGYRVAHHIKYAVSQKNNHAMSEAVGLMLVGHLFPELAGAHTWWRQGRKILVRELKRQCYADGSYLQQSMNYHRVMMHAGMLGVRLAELAGEPLEREVYDILGRSARFLFEMSEPITGQLPLYGNNDGAYVLPLSECDFTDFRPVIQAGHYLATGKRLLPPGPWDEDLLWLFGQDAVDAPSEPSTQPASARFDIGGYYTLRQDHSWLMTRCHTYRDRMGHCDQLHVDLWWRGVNLLRDCGTYQYYIPGREDLERHFGSMAAHNVVQLDGVDSGQKVSRFLIFPWGKAHVRHAELNRPEDVPYFEGEHYDYDRKPWSVRHRRAIQALPDGSWLIVDDLLGAGAHDVRHWWHLADVPVELEPDKAAVQLRLPDETVSLAMATAGGRFNNFEIIRGRDVDGQVQGFASPYYGQAQPIAVIQADVVHANLPLRILTVISQGAPAAIERTESSKNGEIWQIETANTSILIEMATLELAASRMVRQVSLR
ncbi:hypothetical protein LCGC14_0181370 [marine sediment metagenome]|uniref:Uncharacterized protein n=1 Tax=marine sediment metagenome TaxID=412755 RepID=A0A0F9UTP0_9ZZZZ|nr:alginate lyase family protein [Phycisphaerae bacterium]HDZ44393.1 alginate lyase family protein [Phycisphaerae bacterium]